MINYSFRFKSLLLYITLLFIVQANEIIGQEICNNGIDDDGNGLVDFNEEICTCNSFKQVILSGDFEEYSCCPSEFTPLNLQEDGIFCLSDGWMPLANFPTPDYFNTCGYMGEGYPPDPPIPFPSGRGCIGFITQYNFVESVGKCLDVPLEAGEIYQLEFYVGFHDSEGMKSPSPYNLGVYGHPNCENFDVPGEICLSSEGWRVLSSIVVNGEDNTWNYFSLEIIPNVDIKAFSISAACNEINFGDPPVYHFLDNITISKFIIGDSIDVNPVLESGNCVKNKILKIDQDGINNIQWYFNDVPIEGENEAELVLSAPYQEGMYAVYIDSGDGCGISDPIEVTIEYEAINVLGEAIDSPCHNDNQGVILIDLPDDNDPFNVVFTSADDVITYEGLSFGPLEIVDLSAGEYSLVLSDQNGCYGNAEYSVSEPDPLNVSIDLKYPTFLDDFGSAAIDVVGGTAPYEYIWSNGTNESFNSELLPDEYVVTITDVNLCDTVVQFTMFADIDVDQSYIPNVFSPNGDNINDRFNPFSDISLGIIVSNMTIYDRWGSIVFQDSGNVENGWDGKSSGKDVIPGVYLYSISIILPTGEKQELVSDLTVLR